MAEISRLGDDDIAKIKARAARRRYEKDATIFSEGDPADEMYLIESGRVSVVIQEFVQQENVGSLGPGDYFGEMAFFYGAQRSASVVALEDTVLHAIGRHAFLDLYERDEALAARIDRIMAARSRQLTEKESLLDGTGGRAHIGIKGDPSLRESAFTRERYESVADRYLPQLQAQLYDLLINRSAYEASIHFNSGEAHVRSVLDPFGEEIHPVAKLVNKGYIERHFPPMSYEEKGSLVRRIYISLAGDAGFAEVAGCSGLAGRFAQWQPVDPVQLVRVLAKLPLLRRISNFYLRNFTISTLRDAVRMQFNCDGAHIVSVEQFESFLADNVPVEDDSRPADERRKADRRLRAGAGSQPLCERRTPPGRRADDWEGHVQDMLRQGSR